MKERKVIYPGSFNPFTIGHADIVSRALSMADKVVIAIGYNVLKGKPEDMEMRIDSIRNLYRDDPRINVVSYGGLTSDLAREEGACALIRGVRDTRDFEYERALADANLKLGGIDTWILNCRPELGFVSSSLARELKALGKDPSPLLPPGK